MHNILCSDSLSRYWIDTEEYFGNDFEDINDNFALWSRVCVQAVHSKCKFYSGFPFSSVFGYEGNYNVTVYRYCIL